MASFKVFWGESAEDELRAVPFPLRRQLNQRLMKLKAQPLPPGGDPDWRIIFEGSVRLRAYGYKVLYEVDEEESTVVIRAVLPDKA